MHKSNPTNSVTTVDRRSMLRATATGFGHTALLGLLGAESMAASRSPLFKARAKNVIFLFMHGGVSHIDSFDPKPELEKRHGQPLPFDKPLQFAPTGNLMKSPWTFRPYGESGLPISELWPHTGSVIDDICMVRSLKVEQVDHGGAILQLHTGSAVFPRPSMGAWVNYGLGSVNDNLPGFITLCPTTFHGATQLYGSAFLPASYQGTPIGDMNIRMQDARLKNLTRIEGSDKLQQMQLKLIRKSNESHKSKSSSDSRLDARIEALELAYKMQVTAPGVMDISQETDDTYQLYGVNEEPTDNFGRQCLLARRLVESGVRFVQCTHSYKWDQHGDLRGGHTANAKEVDKPIAGMIRDLKQRGLLDETLVIFGTEFGRTPVAQGTDGRDHNPYGFTLWMAGGGVKGGTAYGATDEFGYYAQQDIVSMYDFHATILRLLGIDHEQLTYRHAGRDFRLTDVHGKVITDILA
ncbi:MAG TPA: DUF1501 domain-containing protein [Planctomycetaceae bacterium]|nr:DUF1501 domain-containing protein [Planctomycetaceae bacterium]